MLRLHYALVLLLLVASPVWAQQYGKPKDPGFGTAWDSGTCSDIGDDDDGLAGVSGDSTIMIEDDGSVLYCALTALTDPSDTTNHFLRCRRNRTSNKANTFTVELCNDNTCSGGVIATNSGQTVTDGTLTTVTVPTDVGTMTATSITDYATLWVRLTATGTNPTNIEVSGCELQVPAVAGTGRSRRTF